MTVALILFLLFFILFLGVPIAASMRSCSEVIPNEDTANNNNVFHLR